MWTKRAEELLKQYVTSPNLKRHCWEVAWCMGFYAKIFGEDIDLWTATGLVHDFDYEMAVGMEYPDGHPFKGVEILKSLSFPDIVIDAILGHAEYTGHPRNSLLAKCLFAVDEMSGFIHSCSRVHPSKEVSQITPEFVLKRMKEPSFCRAIDRDHLRKSADELGVDFKTHIENCIRAISEAIN
ncbi:MAG: HDIG domain-containing protein [Deltaproteobacteria bacterium]|nr:HDIG domain-containing protein [Deltaproteobacteria bacterium]